MRKFHKNEYLGYKKDISQMMRSLEDDIEV